MEDQVKGDDDTCVSFLKTFSDGWVSDKPLDIVWHLRRSVSNIIWRTITICGAIKRSLF